MVRTLLGLIALASLSNAKDTNPYSPLQSAGKVEIALATAAYKGDREIPLKLFLPAGTAKPRPVILFSHGLGGSRENNNYTCEHWSGRGYAVVAMQHSGSDEAVWKGVPVQGRMKALREAASAKSYTRRVEDVPAVLDQLAKWNADGGKFAGRFDLTRVGMSGHSFGAVTTQAVSGQSQGLAGQKHTDARIAAALAFSPSPPAVGDAAKAFGKVTIPWLLMTGTKDKSAIGRTTPEARREVFEALPAGAGHHFELVLDGAEHMAFSDRTLIGTKHRNPKHHLAIKAISAAFWDAYLGNNAAAIEWLKGEQPRALLSAADIWQSK